MLKAIITDFDGTLVDTFEANLQAYQYAFAEVGLTLTEEQYRSYFGFRFDRFMDCMGITDKKTASSIKELKRVCYPRFFDYLRPNQALLELVRSFRCMGGKTAIASTASRENLLNVLTYLEMEDAFDMVYTGEDVKQGKPSPEIYIKAMDALNVEPSETLIFEDSEIGLEAAKASGAYCMTVDKWQFKLF